VENHHFKWRQQTLHLTMSVGIGHGTPDPRQLTEGFNDLLAEADEHLYRSKKHGRNCTSDSQSDAQEVAVSPAT